MARLIEFDRSHALNAALTLFWSKGYQATSMTDLLSAMRISRSSFYAAFIDKRCLFIECLDQFLVNTLEVLRRTRAKHPPIDTLQVFLEHHFVAKSGSSSPKAHWGCMLVNTVLEMAGVDDELADRASRHLSEVQRFFRECLQEAGLQPRRADELAAMLMLFNQGIRVSSRRRLPPADLLGPLNTTFELIRSSIT